MANTAFEERVYRFCSTVWEKLQAAYAWLCEVEQSQWIALAIGAVVGLACVRWLAFVRPSESRGLAFLLSQRFAVRVRRVTRSGRPLVGVVLECLVGMVLVVVLLAAFAVTISVALVTAIICGGTAITEQVSNGNRLHGVRRAFREAGRWVFTAGFRVGKYAGERAAQIKQS